jgi:hypothetical protein
LGEAAPHTWTLEVVVKKRDDDSCSPCDAWLPKILNLQKTKKGRKDEKEGRKDVKVGKNDIKRKRKEGT